MNEAYKDRDIGSILNREKKFIKFNNFRMKLKNKNKYKIGVSDFVLYPLVDKKEVLEDLVNRVSFYIPSEKSKIFYILVSDNLKNLNINSLNTPKGQHRYIGNNNNILFIVNSELKEHLDKNIILIHDFKQNIPLSILRKSYKIEIIDKNYFSITEAGVFVRLYNTFFTKEEKLTLIKQSKENFSRLLNQKKETRKSYCFTSGPSFDTYKDYYFEKESFKIICNSIVKNDEFISYIDGPDLIVFADPVFHFGPSSYAEQFRKDVLQVVEKYNSYILVPDYVVPLLLTIYPKLIKNIIGMPMKKDINIPSEELFYVGISANILSLYMLPLAASVSDEIAILGADGRKEEEKYFWKHSSSVQYDDKMESVFITHPSFFRDRDYKDYYKEHCEYMKQYINYCQKSNKSFYSISKSYIPILKSIYKNHNSSNIVLRSKDLLDKIKKLIL